MTSEPTPTRAARRPETWRVVAGVFLAVLVAYHMNDYRGLAADPGHWWAHFRPYFYGDDYAKATLGAEQVSNWYQYYFSISVCEAARRAAGGVPERVFLPTGVKPLTHPYPGDKEGWDDPNLHLGYVEHMTGGAQRYASYESALPQSLIARFEREGRVTEMPWNVYLVRGDADSPRVVLHADPAHTRVYVVPLELSPAKGSL